MRQKVRTAIIPAGGYGTRFLPATKSIPKEMFPLGNKPIILHVVQEAVASGIERIIFVVAHHKHAVENFFSPNEMQEDFFLKYNKKEAVREIRKISKLAEYSFVFAEPPYGNGGAILPAKDFVGQEPFVVVWADEIIISKKKPRIKQCIEVYEKYEKPVISAVEITNPNTRCRYGMADLIDVPRETTIKKINKIIEKPAKGKEPSPFAAHGAYVLPPEVFKIAQKVKLGKDKELWLSDIINELKKETDIFAQIIKDGLYLDCGDPTSYLNSQLEYALSFSDDAKKIKKLICEKANH